MEQPRKLARKWLQSVSSNLSLGEELLLPTKNRADAKEKLLLFNKELKVLLKVDINATELQITTKFKDHRFWLVIKKVAFSPFIAFKKGKDGEIKRILMKDSSEKKRRLRLMLKDGYTIEMIKEIEGNLSLDDLGLLKAKTKG